MSSSSSDRTSTSAGSWIDSVAGSASSALSEESESEARSTAVVASATMSSTDSTSMSSMSSSSESTSDFAGFVLFLVEEALALALDTVAMINLFFGQTLNPCQVGFADWKRV